MVEVNVELIRKLSDAIQNPDRAQFVLTKRISEYRRLLHDRRPGLLLSKTIAGLTGFHPYLWSLRRRNARQIQTDVRDFRLVVNVDDYGISPSLLVYGDRESTLADQYVDLLRRFDSPTIFDVGSHIGYYVVLAATTLEGECEIHAFEPAPENYELLKGNIELNDVAECVTSNQTAVTTQSGTVNLGLAQQGNSHSLKRTTGETIRVDATSLDSYCERTGVDPGTIDVVRIDIEGGEIGALRGMAEIFDAGPPPVCFIEIHPKDLTAHDRREISQTLESHGYSVLLAIAESVVASPWPGPYDVSSFQELESVDWAHGVIAVQPDWIERSSRK